MPWGSQESLPWALSWSCSPGSPGTSRGLTERQTESPLLPDPFLRGAWGQSPPPETGLVRGPHGSQPSPPPGSPAGAPEGRTGAPGPSGRRAG